MNNPNNLQIGDEILIEDAWEDDGGGRHDEYATIVAVGVATGRLSLNFLKVNSLVSDFLRAQSFYAKDYKKINV